jgi:hypothetical protein
MESSSSQRSGLLTAGGILSIVGGSFEVISGGILVGLIVATVMQGAVSMPLLTGNSSDCIIVVMTPIVIPIWTFIVAAALLVLGIIAIVGGISAMMRKRFGLSLAGAICALPSPFFVILGVLAVIFVAMGKREFGAES